MVYEDELGLAVCFSAAQRQMIMIHPQSHTKGHEEKQ